MPIVYAEISDDMNRTSAQKENLHQLQKGEQGRDDYSKHFQKFLLKLNTWNSSLNVTQPPPSHLKYQYPPPTAAVLHNICCALASVPKFYTQVLHLMNRMNLPCPFQSIPFPEAEILQVPEEPSKREDPISEKSSTDETELESEEEEHKLPDEIIPMKRPRLQNPKKVKRPKFIRNIPSTTMTSGKAVRPEEVFEQVTREPVQRKIELKLVTTSEADISTEKISQNTMQTSGSFGLLFPVNTEPEKEQLDEEPRQQETTVRGRNITAGELASNRVSSKDQKHLPVFRNYQPGIPSCRLYIKNLSKQVTERDLHYIYGRYVLPDALEHSGMFNIQLMKEGRMKGQAFVTLQNVKQAEMALKETNGYILKDKPMVVQFARSAQAK